MVAKTSNTLDSEELLHLAVKALQQDQSDLAIVHLKQLLESKPAHATARYLLGAVRAGLGMHARAITDMEEALKINPDLPPIAPFQLGLLYLTTGDVERARSTWKPLDRLGAEHALFLFKRGMLHLAADEFEDCINDLQRGISLNETNERLNDDMQDVIERTYAALAAEDPSGAASADSATQSPQRTRTRLSAYQNVADPGDAKNGT